MTTCIIHLSLLATPAGMRENNKHNQLHCQTALNVVIEIKGLFWEVSNRAPWTLMAAADTEIASQRRDVAALTARNVELTRAVAKVSDLLRELSCSARALHG